MSKNYLLTTIPNKYHMDLNAIKKALPSGGQSKIARKVNVSISTVSYVLSGQRNNEKVIEAAISIIEEEKEKQNKLSERLKAAINA